MRASGVICEFNPIHTGHAHLLARMRETVGEDGCVICLMSGRFVQRGTAAVADPYLRAQMALSAGADLVLELPFPWSAASAEHFARAGVRALARLGVETIAFGSESGDRDRLLAAARAVATPAFGEVYASLVRSGMGTAGAYTEAVRRIMNDQYSLCDNDFQSEQARDRSPDPPPTAASPKADSTTFPASNDLLGIAYLRALLDLRNTTPHVPEALVIRREGADYRDTTLPADAHPSATALRRLIREAAEDPLALEAILEGTMPPEAQATLLEAIRRGDAPIDGGRLLAFYHAHYRLADPTALAACAECGGGLAAHIVRCAQKASSPKAFFESLRTRQYTDARLRRALLFGVIGVTDADLRADPTYTTLLAATPRGCAYLAACKHVAKATAPTEQKAEFGADAKSEAGIDARAGADMSPEPAPSRIVSHALPTALPRPQQPAVSLAEQPAIAHTEPLIGSLAEQPAAPTGQPLREVLTEASSASAAPAAEPSQTAAETDDDAPKTREAPQNHHKIHHANSTRNHEFTTAILAEKPRGTSVWCLPIPVVTKPADAPPDRQTDLARRADALFTLCFPAPRPAGELLRRTPHVRR